MCFSSNTDDSIKIEKNFEREMLDEKDDAYSVDSIDEKDYEALILDCDGVMVDSEYFSCTAWNVVFFREFQIDIGDNYEEILGKNSEDTIKHYLLLYGIPINKELINRLKETKEKVYFEIANNKLQTKPGIIELIQQARDLGLKVGVASSGTKKKILFNLEQTGLRYAVDVIVGAEGEIRGKPFPDVFLTTAKKLGVRPDKCIVVEDTPAGIKAAKRAGMFVIGLAGTFPAEELKLTADLVVNSLEEIDLSFISNKKRKILDRIQEKSQNKAD